MGYDVYTEAQESLTERNSRNTAVEVEQADKGKGTNLPYWEVRLEKDANTWMGGLPRQARAESGQAGQEGETCIVTVDILYSQCSISTHSDNTQPIMLL